MMTGREPVLITARVFNVVGQPALEFLRKNGCEVIVPEQFGPYKLPDLLPRLRDVDATLCSPDAYNAQALQSTEAAKLKINPAQVPFLERLTNILSNK